ncbi:MAG: hypothetical protein CMB45_05085 [Euryarchaeota archaeon]|nr:hypothetical protein [Euryarchaeota archaeon]|tara:strand:- start:12819 stop:13145 length:327 start_codon:yes stop_codon:yes gene_type:complete
MGRDLTEDGKGWCFRETVSEAYGRVSRYFVSKEAAITCLEQNGYHPHFVNMIKESGHVPSFVMGSTGMYACGLKLDDALSAGGMLTDNSEELHQLIGEIVGAGTNEEE